MVIDCFTYNGEEDILELHLDMMYPHVDRFVIVEGHETFNGESKPLYYKLQESRFKKWADKITYYEVTKEEDYPNNKELLALADSSPNVPRGIEHWRREFYKKELIKNALKDLQDDDICIIGDVDEVWNHEILNLKTDDVVKLRMRVYTYYIDNASNEEFYGPIYTKYKNVKNGILNHLRQFEHSRTIDYCGWHFTNMGGQSEILRKVFSAYDEFEARLYANILKGHMMNNRDYMGRDFKLGVDTTNWPDYLKDNKDKYKHLLYNENNN